MPQGTIAAWSYDRAYRQRTGLQVTTQTWSIEDDVEPQRDLFLNSRRQPDARSTVIDPGAVRSGKLTIAFPARTANRPAYAADPEDTIVAMYMNNRFRGGGRPWH